MKAIIITVCLVIVGFVLAADWMGDFRKPAFDNPEAVYMKPYPRSIYPGMGPFTDGQVANFEFDLTRDDKPRIKVWVADSDVYYMTIIKNGRFLCDVNKGEGCMLAIGSYEIQIKLRYTDEIYSRVFFEGSSKMS